MTTPVGAVPESTASELTSVALELCRYALKGPSGLGALRRYEQVAFQTANLIHDSGLLAFQPGAEHSPFPLLLDPHAMRFFMHEFGFRPRRMLVAVVEGLLTRPAAFDPQPLWALFWALLKAEHEFLFRYVRFWSHEERLTGHLVSQLVDRVEEFDQHWTSLAETYGSAGSRPRCSVAYFDTATARQEKMTGADLALVIHGRYGPGAEFFKVARFQAKKANAKGKATIDLDQVNALTQVPGLGFYLLYHEIRDGGGTPPPTVRPAGDFQHLLADAENRRGLGLGTQVVDALTSGWDFASFLTFGLADPASDHGVASTSPYDAAAIAFGRRADMEAPSRVLVLTLGSPSVVDWDRVTAEWMPRQEQG